MQKTATAGANAIDELFEVKTFYYIGAYQQCLNEINKLSRVSICSPRIKCEN